MQLTAQLWVCVVGLVERARARAPGNQVLPLAACAGRRPSYAGRAGVGAGVLLHNVGYDGQHARRRVAGQPPTRTRSHEDAPPPSQQTQRPHLCSPIRHIRRPHTALPRLDRVRSAWRRPRQLSRDGRFVWVCHFAHPHSLEAGTRDHLACDPFCDPSRSLLETSSPAAGSHAQQGAAPPRPGGGAGASACC